ncbi:MAG TPA: VOC family protein [Acidimicrobiales bacterium]|nr:VOC family protein [Acidimicrobiales bacterium]
MPVVPDVGLFHRLGVAIREGTAPGAPDGGAGAAGQAASWFAGVLGAEVEAPRPEPGDTHSTTMLWLGRSPVALFAAKGDDTTGTIGRYLTRFGPGLHSLAWRVRDLQGAEDALRRRGCTIVGVNREARHFFLHPKETFGILLELTDQRADEAPRQPGSRGLVREIAWVTAAVGDLAAAEALFAELLGAAPVHGLPSGPRSAEETRDLAIGDAVLRLVRPSTAASRYAGFLADVGDRLHSVALRVDSLDQVPLRLVDRDGQRGWTDPAATFGVRFEWVS